MKKVMKILVPVNFTPASINGYQYAMALADVTGAKIELLHVVHPEMANMDVPVLAAQATQKRVETAVELIRTFRQVHSLEVKHDVTVETDVEVGGAPNTIAFVAKRDEVDLVIMGRDPDHTRLDRWLGTTSSAVINKAHCPVIVVPPNYTFKRPETAIYATDLREEDPFQIWQAFQLIDPCVPILKVVHVNRKGEAKAAEMLEQFRAFFEDQLPALKIEFHHLPGGRINELIAEFEDMHNADMLIMHRPDRSWLEDLFHRSMTERMARSNSVPLLVLKSSK
ncbi:MAG: universal stress protein [Saprospiraceae bacterium]|nr:universal stress protein [Saprospiraceae bacterium]